jgi:hypothetical protein
MSICIQVGDVTFARSELIMISLRRYGPLLDTWNVWVELKSISEPIDIFEIGKGRDHAQIVYQQIVDAWKSPYADQVHIPLEAPHNQSDSHA